MVIITFPDVQTQKAAIAVLIGQFKATIFKSGEHIVPEEALAALASENLVFTVQGKADENKLAALRSAAAASLQRRARRSQSVAGRSRH